MNDYINTSTELKESDENFNGKCNVRFNTYDNNNNSSNSNSSNNNDNGNIYFNLQIWRKDT